MYQTNNYLALDLELNKEGDDTTDIIQVGIAIGNRGQDWEDYTTRSWILAPSKPLDPFIIDLTGITEDDIATKAVPWATMASELGALIREHDVFVNPVTWGGGDTAALLQQIHSKGIQFPYFGRRWIDVKTPHVVECLATGKNPAGGLAKSMAKYGLRFEGDAHRADVDAVNTLRLLFRFMDRINMVGSARSLLTKT